MYFKTFSVKKLRFVETKPLADLQFSGASALLSKRFNTYQTNFKLKIRCPNKLQFLTEL